VLLAATAGSAAFVAWQSDSTNHTAALIGGVVGLAAAILASVQTFLDLGARAERHRQAAIDFKKILRTFERIPSSVGDLRSIKDDSEEGRVLQQLEAALMEADRRAPVVPKRLGDKVEAMPVDVVRQAEKLAPPKVTEPEPEPEAPATQPDGAAPEADGGSARKVEDAPPKPAKLAPPTPTDTPAAPGSGGRAAGRADGPGPSLRSAGGR
jgi:hypothetical protein